MKDKTRASEKYSTFSPMHAKLKDIEHLKILKEKADHTSQKQVNRMNGTLKGSTKYSRTQNRRLGLYRQTSQMHGRKNPSEYSEPTKEKGYHKIQTF